MIKNSIAASLAAPLISAAIILASCNVFANGFPAPSVNIVKADKKMLAPTNWVSGTLISRNNSKLAVEVSGRLQSLAELGQTVKKGDLLAQIDTTAIEIEKREQLASIDSAKARLTFLESEVERKTQLANRNLSAKTDRDETISQRQVAQGDLTVAEARLSQIQQKLKFAKLRAPFNGLVAERLSNQGEFVSSGTAIIRLVETDNLEASLYAPITSYQFLQQAQRLAVSSALGKGTAPIKALVPAANERSHLMQVRLDMSAFNWPVGLAIKVAVANGKSQHVIAVPRDALVLRREGTSVVRINSENKAEHIPVKLGVAAGELIEIIGAVNVGDKIVVRGAENLRPGQAVQIKASNDNLVSGKE
jgi:RND family efflux transporter MFP subunit